FDPADLERLEREALRREHIADLRGPDPERNRAERAVRRCVAVAARDRHARLRQSELGTDDVNDPLLVGPRCVQLNPELAAVALENAGHLFGRDVEEWPPL